MKTGLVEQIKEEGRARLALRYLWMLVSTLAWGYLLHRIIEAFG